MKCSTCRYFGDGKPHGIPNDGACHYQPPFPRVRHKDWCSRWFSIAPSSVSVDQGSVTNGVWDVEWKRDGNTVAFKLSPTVPHEIKLPTEAPSKKLFVVKIGQEMWL